MSFVLDASVTLAWCFSDESTPKVISLLKSLETESAHVPQLWPLEVGNILVAAERRKRISYANIAEFLALLENLDIQIDEGTAQRGFHEILSLSYSTQLTTYDSAYLELAMRLGLPLATKDIQLQKIAKQVGVKLINCN